MLIVLLLCGFTTALPLNEEAYSYPRPAIPFSDGPSNFNSIKEEKPEEEYLPPCPPALPNCRASQIESAFVRSAQRTSPLRTFATTQTTATTRATGSAYVRSVQKTSAPLRATTRTTAITRAPTTTSRPPNPRKCPQGKIGEFPNCADLIIPTIENEILPPLLPAPQKQQTQQRQQALPGPPGPPTSLSAMSSMCPPGTVDLYPICIPIPTCPEGTTGTFPNCQSDETSLFVEPDD